MRRLIVFSLCLMCLAGSSWLGLGLGKFEREAVYPFDSTRIAPAELGLLTFEEIMIRSSGHSLVVWVAQPAKGQPTIFYLHGNAGNLANRARRFDRMIARGYGVIAPAYRGSSGSTGRPNETVITSDINRIYSQLGGFVPGLGPQNTVIYGESLGTGVALKLLATGNNPQPSGIILEAPFTSLPDVVRHIYPQFETLIPHMKNQWNSRAHASSLRAPLLILHGSNDDLVPPEQGREVYAAAGSDQKQFLSIPDAGHSTTWRSDSLPVLWRFIDGL